MLSLRFAVSTGLASLLAITSCGADAPPPAARSANRARPSGPRGEPTASGGGSSASLGDSALEPAAIQASKDEDWERAEALYRELVRRQPGSATAKRGWGVALMHQQKTDQAIEALEQSVRLADDAHARLDLAAAFGSVGRYPSALPHLRKAVELAPREPATWTALADALVKVEKPDSAAETLRDSRKACTACPKNDAWNRVADEVALASVTKAEKQLSSGDLPAARKSAEVALRMRPNLPEGQLVAGKLARAEGDTKAAADAFRKVVEQTPDATTEAGAGARLELASLLIADGKGPEAVKLAEDVVAAHGEDFRALDTLGRACDTTRNVDCARKAYGRLARLPAGAGDASFKPAVEHARLRMKQLKPRRKRRR
ncbi:MAG: tetratricopeptide repeat protein [Myxococcales bacterium]